MTSVLSHIYVLAGEAPASPPAGGTGTGGGGAAGLLGMLPFVAILVVFFWLTSRSNKKREQARREMLGSIQVKDDVVTISGIHGRIMQVRDDDFVLRIDPDKDVRITIAKTGVSRKLDEAAAE